MTKMLVSIRDLTQRLPSGGRTLTVLDGVSLDIATGETVAIAGPSGSGKSTLLGLVAGLDAPTSGSIVVAGVEVTRLGEAALARFRRETLGYVFQSYHLIPTLTAAENVGVPLDLAGVSGTPARVAELAAGVRPADRGPPHPPPTPRREPQRAALARAMALDPPLLLADEPTGNLDSATGAAIIDLLFALNRERGTTLLLVTHDATLAARADRVVSLRDGRIAGERRRAAALIP